MLQTILTSTIVITQTWFFVSQECCEKYDQCSKTRNLVRVCDIKNAFFAGLASFIQSRKNKDESLIPRGKKHLETMQLWEKGCTWNFENKVLLLQAEYYFAKGEYEEANTCYEKSIESAKEHKFIHEEALGNELFGIFYVETGDSAKATSFLDKACQLYDEWGAFKKAAMLLPL